MVSLVVPRSQLLSPVAGLLLVITIVISFTAVTDSARVTSATNEPVEVYPGCNNTMNPKECSVKLSNLTKSVAETKAIIAGPKLAAEYLKSDSCITECTKVLDETASKATAAKANLEALRELKGYLYDKVIANYGPIGPCECNCPEPCSVDEAATVKKLGEATGSMRILGTQLQELFDSDAADEFYGLE